MMNGLASGHASALASTRWASTSRPIASSAETAGGVGEEQVDAAGVGDELAVRQAAARIAPIGFGDDALEVGEVAAHRARQLAVVAAAVADVVEHGAPLVAVDRTDHDPALAGADARPDRRRGGGIERPGDGLEVEVKTSLGLPARADGGSAVTMPVLVARGARQQIAERPAFAAVGRRAALALPVAELLRDGRG